MSKSHKNGAGHPDSPRTDAAVGAAAAGFGAAGRAGDGRLTAIYARQSVEVRDSISVETQIAICRGRLPPGTAVEIFTDRGFSGATEQRPGWQACMQAVRQGRVGQICVYKLDRLIRSMAHFARMMQELEEHRVSICCELGVLDLRDPACALQTNILMSFAEFERETIRARVRDNYYARGRRGMYLGGPPPFGYEKILKQEGGACQILLRGVEPEAERVRDLFARCAEGASLGVLARAMNAAGVRTARGKPFSSAVLSRLLHNPVYVRADAEVYAELCGRGARMTDAVSDYDGTRGVWIYGNACGHTGMKFSDLTGRTASLAQHEGLIAADCWLECQRRLAKNKTLRRTGQGRRTWLSGVLVCGVCGRACSPVGEYLTCGGKKLGVCTRRNPALRLSELEHTVQRVLLAEIERINAAEENPADEDRQRALAQLNRELEEIMRRRRGWIETLDGEAADGDVRAEIRALTERCHTLREEIQRLSTAYSPGEVRSLAPLMDLAQSGTLAQKKRILALFFPKIALTDQGLTFFRP